MIELFTQHNDSMQLSERPIAITSSDDITLIASHNSIYNYNPQNAQISKNESIEHDIQKPIKDIQLLPYINVLVIQYDDCVVIRHLSISNKKNDQVIYIQSTKLHIWNNLHTSHMVSNDSNSDSMSLATTIVKTDYNDDETNEKNNSLISFLAIVSDSQIIILKWSNSDYIDRYNLYITEVKFIQFLKNNELVCMSSTNENDLIHINLKSSKVKHHNLQKYLNLKKKIISYKNYNQLSSLSYFNNQLIFVEYIKFINISYPKFKPNLSIDIEQSNFKYSQIHFPFIFIIYDSFIEVRSIQNFQLFQTIKLNSIIQLDFSDDLLFVLTKDKVLSYDLLNYNKILAKLDELNDFDNAILLLENLNITKFINNSNDVKNDKINLKQLKFIKIRKFKLQKAISLINEDFDQAFDLFIEYLASPNQVIDNLPENLQTLFDFDRIEYIPDLSPLIRHQINRLINYLTDSRRKIIKFQENKDAVFTYNNLEISLSIYQSDENFSIMECLKLIDTYLFKCYLFVNIKMINPFLRIQNYCDFQLVENSCQSLDLYDQLSTFYYTRKDYQSSISLLIRSNKINELVLFLQKLIQNDDPPINLIFNNLKYIIVKNDDSLSEENFKSIFLNDYFDYSNLNYKEILKQLEKHNLTTYIILYLEYLIFHEHVTVSDITNRLFDYYFLDVDANYEKIENLYSLGNYNSNMILNKLKELPVSENSKRLSIQPLMKLGKYDDVLGIYIHDLNDVESSIEFALRIKDIKGLSLCKGLIFKILDICLQNKDYTSITKHILNNTELTFVDFEEILIKLPNEISMGLMSSFLIMNLKNLNTLSHNLIIKNELLKVNVINMKLDKMNLEEKMVKLNYNSVCAKCVRTFGNSEIICFHPDGRLLHYKCSKDK